MSGRCDTCGEVGYVWCGDCLGPHPEDAIATREKLRSERALLRAAITEALYDYDHGDELGAIDRLRAIVAKWPSYCDDRPVNRRL